MRDEIKRLGICVLSLLACIVGILFLRVRFFSVQASADVSFPPENYPDFGEVVELIPESDLVVIQTHDGNQWAMIGVEDWIIGDHCCMVFDDNGTRLDRSDDRIVSVRYVSLEN